MRPLILFVPGLLPKPRADDHRDALLRCLIHGLKKNDADVAASIVANAGCFNVVAWTYDFYGEHRDILLDNESIDEMLSRPGPTQKDLAEAGSWQRKLLRLIYLLGDHLPFSAARLAGPRVAAHLRDLRRYELNRNGAADAVREKLRQPLQQAADAGRPVLLIGHSMGSIIAYDVLWDLTQSDKRRQVDLLMTIGSPLGQRFLQRRRKGHRHKGQCRYPGNIRCWRNLAAVGDLTSLDRSLADDFAEMVELGLIEDIVDEEVVNYFRLDGVLNVHTEYGYLVSPAMARIVAGWWREHAAVTDA